MYFFSNGLINNSDVQVGKKIQLLGIEKNLEEQIRLSCQFHMNFRPKQIHWIVFNCVKFSDKESNFLMPYLTVISKIYFRQTKTLVRNPLWKYHATHYYGHEIRNKGMCINGQWYIYISIILARKKLFWHALKPHLKWKAWHRILVFAVIRYPFLTLNSNWQWNLFSKNQGCSLFLTTQKTGHLSSYVYCVLVMNGWNFKESWNTKVKLMLSSD